MRKQGSPPGDGSALIAFLLLLCLGLVALITWQAQAAARSHRRVAEEILRDFAGLAADEMVQRSARDLGYYGYYPLLIALEKQAAGKLPELAELEVGNSRLDRSRPLARTLFRFDPAAGSLLFSGTPLAPPVADLLVKMLSAEPLASGRPDRYRARHRWSGGELRGFAFAMPEAEQEGSAVLGFEVEIEALGEWFQQAFDRGPLLPASLAERGVGNQLVRIEVLHPQAGTLFRFGPAELRAPDPYAPDLTAERPFGDTASGVLDGLSVRATLAEEAAPRLLIGGLPKSRLPLLAALLVLTCGLLLAAILQLRRARALGRLRSEFVAEVSHELRTPLTQIRMFSETLLLGRVRSAEERRRSLQIIDQEARRLSHLVDNVLQFSRGERGALALKLECRELAPWVGEQVAGFAPLAASRGVRIHCQLVAGARAVFDHDALRQILLNLLDNAIKYGPPGQRVTVGIEVAEQWLRLYVEDQGPGVPARQQQSIWRSFHRLGRDRRSAVAGAGIGLAVVRQLSELHGGRAWVEDGIEGGARFVVELPRGDPQLSSPDSPQILAEPSGEVSV